jgi:hypothetical protein
MSEVGANGEEATEKLLVRLREAYLFLVKSDAIVLAALSTLASVFKLEASQALEIAAKFPWVLKSVGILLASSLGFWALAVMASPSSDMEKNARIVGSNKLLFSALTFAHFAALLYTLGFIEGYLEIMHAR